MAEQDESLDDVDDVPDLLTPGARKLVEAAVHEQEAAGHKQLGTHHWLLVLLERHGPMAEALVRGLEAAALRKQVRDQLHQGTLGTPLDEATVVRQAGERAQARGKDRAVERDLAAIILAAAGHSVTDVPPVIASAKPASASGAHPSRARKPTPALDFFGRDLTALANEGKLSPMVGRQDELQLTIETLCRRTKRNPVLVGPAGVGKTAIVEGLAQRIASGEVPTMLKGVRLIGLQPAAVVAGAAAQGELEHRMQAILAEASQDGIILFIDEIHSIIGAGGMPGTGDIASLLKPALARGDLACIAATTDDEYRRFIEPDGALERRFQPVRVQEPTLEQTLQIMTALRDELARVQNVRLDDAVLPWLLNFAQQCLRNRHFPDKAVDLLEQCVAHAIMRGKNTVEVADAEAVAERLIGVPPALTERLEALRVRLTERGLLPPADIEALGKRLQVTMRGLDLRPTRPNAVVLLAGKAAANSAALAENIAEVLFGDAARVVAIDFSRFTHPADITMLVGAPPGYIGYGESLPLHRVAQMPWCVLLGENIHACHPQVREVFQQALASGFLTDAHGKRIYLSDAIVLLTADLGEEAAHGFGFERPEDVPATHMRQAAEETLGPVFTSHCDVLCAGGDEAAPSPEHWDGQHLLTELAARYRQQGIDLHWDDSVLQWLAGQTDQHASQQDWERLVDERLSPLLIPHLPAGNVHQMKSVRVKYEAEKISIDAQGR